MSSCTYFIDVSVALPSVRNVKQKEAEKKLKYKNLSTAIQLEIFECLDNLK
jgi:hypothetical protein